jgi:NADPH:quinone reductase-like Zn-dependent oxidoreductase
MSVQPGTRTIRIDRAGGHDELRLVELPRAEPGPGEARVATRAIGVNYADCIVRMGLYASAKEYVGWPITPGFEFSGVVDALGAGVAGLEAGARVFGVTRFGAYSSDVVVPPHQLFPIPASWSFAEAACFPTVFLTAWYALRELCKLRPGMRVLIHSAAGGVGCAATQVAVACGCEVTAVVGAAHKQQTARASGATHVIDRSQARLGPALTALAPGGFDVVLDPNGSATLRQSYRHLAPAGRLIVYGFHTLMARGKDRPSYLKLALGYLRTPRFNPFDMNQHNKSVLAFNLSYLFERAPLLAEAMTELMAWVQAGKLRPLPFTEVPFPEVARAHAALESGQSVGKLVLIP